MQIAVDDSQPRQAAFDHVNRLATIKGGVLDSGDLAAGFEFQGERIPLINPQRGIFKPRQMVSTCCPSEPCSPGKAGASGMTIKRMLTGRSTRAMMLSNTHSWAPTRTRLITAGCARRCRNRSRSSISSGPPPAGLSRSHRPSSWGGIPSAYGSSLRSGRSWGHRLKQPRRPLPSGGMRYAR